MPRLEALGADLLYAIGGMLRDPRDALALLSASKALKAYLTVVLKSQFEEASAQALLAGFEMKLRMVTAIIQARNIECIRLVGTWSPTLRDLKELTLTELSGTHVKELAELLGRDSLPRLLLLRLQSDLDAPMGNAGAIALAFAFDEAVMRSLETLGEWLSCPCTTRIEPGSNPATVDWPTVLPRALSDLDKNGIGDEGLTRLARSLPQLRSLLQLSLNGNPFSANGIRCLELEIDQMPALRELSITEIPVTDVAADALVLQAQKALRKTLLRSVASRPQSVAKTMGAHVQLYSFLVGECLVYRPRCCRSG